MDIEIKKTLTRGEDERLKQRLHNIQTPSQSSRKKSFNWGYLLKLVISLVLLAGIVLLGVYFVSKFDANNLANNKSDWQAVFLVDGSVYFAKVVSENDDTLIIRNIYYLQQPRALQNSLEKVSGDVAIIKLGSGEVHGPMDEMRINREHILFVEDLKDSSKVVEAINEHIGK